MGVTVWKSDGCDHGGREVVSVPDLKHIRRYVFAVCQIQEVKEEDFQALSTVCVSLSMQKA